MLSATAMSASIARGCDRSKSISGGGTQIHTARKPVKKKRIPRDIERMEFDRIAEAAGKLITSDQVTDKDVLPGRGGGKTHDENHQSYLDVIDVYHDEYLKDNAHGKKQEVLDKVIKALHNDGRRFLIGVMDEDGVYREMATKEIQNKVSQRLRELRQAKLPFAERRSQTYVSPKKRKVLNRLLVLDQAKLPFLERSSQTYGPRTEADDEPPAAHAHDAVVHVNNHDDTNASYDIPNDNDFVDFDLIRSDYYQEQDLPVALVKNKSTLHDKIKEWRRQHEDGFTSGDDDSSSAGRINTEEVLAVDPYPTFFDDAYAIGMPNYQVGNDDIATTVPTMDDSNNYEPIDVNTDCSDPADLNISANDWDDVLVVLDATSNSDFQFLFTAAACVENVGNV